MKRMLIATLALAVSVGLSYSAHADNETAAQSRGLPMGIPESDSVAASGFASYDVQLVTARSYIFAAWDPFSDLNMRSGLGITLFEDDGVSFPPGLLGNPGEPRFPSGSAAGAIIRATSGRFKLRVQNLNASTATFVVGVFETTLVSPWFFRDGNYDGVVEIRNETNSNQLVQSRIYDTSGALICFLTDTVPKNGGTVYGVGSRCGLGSAFGGVQLSHGAAPGGIVANLTTLSAMTGLSFDAPFTPRHVYGGFMLAP
jgi:hypothetical protein